MKKPLKVALIVLTAMIIVAGIYLHFLFADQIRAIRSITELGPGLYYLEYRGDYGFPAFLERGGAKSDEEVAAYLAEFLSRGFYKYQMAEETGGCSTLAARTKGGEFLFGRNFDWPDTTSLIVKTVPEQGYASISTVNINFLGFGDNFAPENLMEKLFLLAATFVPMDGMNEKGLCVADLMVECPGETHQSTGKPSLTTTTAIRLLLDQAATVEEATALLRRYDLHSSAGMMHHLALADAGGRAVVVEYIDHEMRVTETPVVTNHFLTPGADQGTGSEPSKRRFEILEEQYKKEGGMMNAAQLRDALSRVAQSNCSADFGKTAWSIVYNQTAGDLSFYHREDFENPLFFRVSP